MSTSWGTPLADKMNPTNRKCTPPVKWGASKISGIIIRVLCQQKGHHQKVMSFLLVEETKGDSNPLKSNMPVACWQNQCKHWFSPYRFPSESGPSNPPSPALRPRLTLVGLLKDSGNQHNQCSNHNGKQPGKGLFCQPFMEYQIGEQNRYQDAELVNGNHNAGQPIL